MYDSQVFEQQTSCEIVTFTHLRSENSNDAEL